MMQDWVVEADATLRWWCDAMSYLSGPYFHVVCPIFGPLLRVHCLRCLSPFWVCKDTASGKVLHKVWRTDRLSRGWRGMVGEQEVGVGGVPGAQQLFPYGSRCWDSTGLAPSLAWGPYRKEKPGAHGWGKGTCSLRLRQCRYTGACTLHGSFRRFDKFGHCIRRSDHLLLLKRDKKTDKLVNWQNYCYCHCQWRPIAQI